MVTLWRNSVGTQINIIKFVNKLKKYCLRYVKDPFLSSLMIPPEKQLDAFNSENIILKGVD